jgi:hypothetical protein
MDIERAREIKRRHEDALIKIPGVTGIAVNHRVVGGKPTDEVVITVYVKQKGVSPPSDQIPASIEGVPTEVVERSFRPH